MTGASDGACDEFSDSIIGLALGGLAGRERAGMLSHLTVCPRCRVEVEDFSRVVDALLLLAPEVEPPAGLEVEVARRHSPIERSMRRRVLVLCSAVAVVAGAFGAGSLLGREGRPSSTTGLGAQRGATTRTAALIVGRADRGEVLVSSGKPAWLFMSVRDSGWTRTVTCTVTVAGGRTITLGSFNVSSGYASWGAPLPVPAAQVRAVELSAADGSPLGLAQLGI